jgi:MFS family permease
VFVFTTFLVALPAGYITDRYNRTRIITFVLASWGAISAMNAAVRSYWQFLGVRATLGVAEAINNPGSNSLRADYYPPAVRTRAYSFLRAAPIVGTALGTGLGGLVGELFGWRWAFLLVGVPGSMLAIAVWRLPEPRRGESDGATTDEVHELARGFRALAADVRLATSIPTLRSLMVGLAMATGALVGIGFWAPTYYERHAGLSSGAASGVTGGLILVGALVGTLVGGRVSDRLRPRYEGAPMLFAGVSLFIGTALIMPTFLPVPMWVRLPLQLPAVGLIVGGLPALATMIAEVVPPAMRGTAFSVTGLFTALAGALSPLLIGFISDRFPLMVDGEEKGHLGNAFLCVLPIVLLGAVVVLRGRRHVAADTARALGASPSLSGSVP